MSPEDERELAGLVGQVVELKGTPYALDAVKAIEDWWDRRYVRALERRAETELARKARQTQLVLQVLRETTPRQDRVARAERLGPDGQGDPIPVPEAA